MRNRTITYFEGKISQVLARNKHINNIHELATLVLRNQSHSDLNEYYLDVALAQLDITFKKVIKQNNETIKPFSIAA